MYFEFTPKHLSHVISALWWSDSEVDPDQGHIVAPTVNPELVIKLYQNTAETIISGPMTRQKQYPYIQNAQYFGIRFTPHVGSLFTNFLLSELKDSSENIKQLLDIDLTTFAHQLNDLDSQSAQMALMNKTVNKRRFHDVLSSNPHVLHAIHLANQHNGNMTVTEIASVIGISRRHLERLFTTHVGLSPKSFCKILRIQSVLKSLDTNPSRPLARLAVDSGFTDQAHLARDFKSIMGMSIGAYRQS